MAVLTLTGKRINWAKPPKATTKVLWSQRTTSGKRVTGSLRTIAMLDHLNHLAKKRFGRGIIVYQGPYNTTVKISAGTHDYDACLDIWIPGVPGYVQQRFVRANGGGGFYRLLAQGFLPHIHFFVLPHRHGSDVSRDYMLAGFKVGYLVDGGWSTKGRVISSSQIKDYYTGKDALADHAHDTSWFPPSIKATIFNLHEYIDRHARKQAAAKAA
jgi:hypothetical protein